MPCCFGTGKRCSLIPSYPAWSAPAAPRTPVHRCILVNLRGLKIFVCQFILQTELLVAAAHRAAEHKAEEFVYVPVAAFLPSLSRLLAASKGSPCQSPAILIRLMPVILPAALKPNRRLAASPRGKTSFTTQNVCSPIARVFRTWAPVGDAPYSYSLRYCDIACTATSVS